SPKKIPCEVGQLLRQRDTLLVRQLAALAPLHLEQERALDRVDVRSVRRFESIAVVSLLLGGRKGHGGHAGPVTLPSTSPVHSAGNPGRTGVVFIGEFEPVAAPESSGI